MAAAQRHGENNFLKNKLGTVVCARPAGLSISKTAHLLGYSLTTIF